MHQVSQLNCRTHSRLCAITWTAVLGASLMPTSRTHSTQLDKIKNFIRRTQ